MLVVDLALFVCLNFGHLYGLVENRLFREAGEYFPDHHFRLYHGWLAMLDLADAVVVLALSGSWLLAAFAAVYFPLGLDVVWWVKRWLDFHFRLYVYNVPIFLGPVASLGYYKEPYAWHARGDWDNYGAGPLLFGIYRWWWIFGSASTCLLVLSII